MISAKEQKKRQRAWEGVTMMVYTLTLDHVLVYSPKLLLD